MTDQPPTGNLNHKPLFDRQLWLILFASVIGLWLYFALGQLAFPEVELKLKNSRSESQEKAVTFTHALGYTPKRPIVSTTFSSDEQARNYIEHEYKPEERNQLMNSSIPVWLWNTRICEEHQPEEVTTVYSTEGLLMELIYKLPPNFEGSQTSHERAREIARSFVDKYAPDANVFSRLVSDSTSEETNWQTHYFSWEDPNHDYHGARVRIAVSVAGSKIVFFHRYLHIQEAWSRQFASKWSPKVLITTLTGVFAQLLHLAVITIACWAILTRNIRWRVAIAGGSLLGILAALNYLNNFPLLLRSYYPMLSFNNFILSNLTQSAYALVFGAINGIALFAASEVVYRKFFPDHLATEVVFSRNGFQSQSVLRGLLAGGFLCGVGLGWIVTYYFLGQRFGIWCPLSLTNAETLSSIAPFFSAMATAAKAAISEELSYRVIGLAIGLRLFRNFWLANLFQSLLWAFSHSNYPQEPAWARGLELTVVGFTLGWILRKYGVLACLCEHYLFNTYWQVRPLLLSGHTNLVFSALIAFIPYMAVTARSALYRLRAKGEDSIKLVKNSGLALMAPAVEPSVENGTQLTTHKISSKTRLGLAVACVLAIACQFNLPSRNYVGASTCLTISRDQAIEKAKKLLTKNQIDTSGWMMIANSWVNPAGESFQFIKERKGLAFARSYYDDTGLGFHWLIHFFKPNHTNQYTIGMNSQGNCEFLQYFLSEDAPGIELSEAQARQTAETLLNSLLPQATPLVPGPVSVTKRPNRTDYSVSFTCPKLKVDEAPYRIQIDLQGDKFRNLNHYLDTPKKWRFERSKERNKNELLPHLRTLIHSLKNLLFCIWCIAMLRNGMLTFKPAAAIALLYMSLLIVDSFCVLPQFYANYHTATPLNNFIAESVLSRMSAIFDSTVRTCLLASFCFAALKELVPKSPLESFVSQLLERDANNEMDAKQRLTIVTDAILIAWGAVAVLQIHNYVFQSLYLVFSPAVLTALSNPNCLASMANTNAPLVQMLCCTFKSELENSGYLIIICFVAARYFRYRWLAMVTVLIIVLIEQSSTVYWQNYLIAVASQFSLYAIYCFFIAKVARDNYLAYAFYFLIHPLLLYAILIGNNDATLFRTELLSSIVIMCAPLLWAFLLWNKAKPFLTTTER